MTIFARNLKFLRELKGLKQAEMLDSCGFKQSTWNGYERGASTPNLNDLIKISDFFKIPESDLLHTEINEKNLHPIFGRYKGQNMENNNSQTGGKQITDNILEEPAEEYEKPCRECIHLRKIVTQKEETIAALQGQIAALQIAIETLKEARK